MTPKDYHFFMNYIKRCKNTNTLNKFSEAIEDQLKLILINKFNKVIDSLDGGPNDVIKSLGIHPGTEYVFSKITLDKVDTKNKIIYLDLLYDGHLIYPVYIKESELDKFL